MHDCFWKERAALPKLWWNTESSVPYGCIALSMNLMRFYVNCDAPPFNKIMKCAFICCVVVLIPRWHDHYWQLHSSSKHVNEDMYNIRCNNAKKATPQRKRQSCLQKQLERALHFRLKQPPTLQHLRCGARHKHVFARGWRLLLQSAPKEVKDAPLRRPS